jgi:cephalosporin hydroxylase
MADTRKLIQAARALHRRLEPGLTRLLLGAGRRLKLPVIAARSPELARDLPREWTRTLWQNELWRGNSWYGMPILQWPTDLLMLQELVAELRPRVIVETGTYRGGSAVFFASLLHLFGIEEGHVISVDVHVAPEVAAAVARHPLGGRITIVEGSSIAPETLHRVTDLVGDEKNVLVFLDSDHTYRHVLEELRAYQGFVPPGGSLCAFDTIMKDLWDLPLAELSWKDDNPHRAVLDFLAENGSFEIDRTRNRLAVGFAPDGYLKRIRLP